MQARRGLAQRSHNPKVVDSNPTPSTYSKGSEPMRFQAFCVWLENGLRRPRGARMTQREVLFGVRVRFYGHPRHQDIGCLLAGLVLAL